MRKLLVIPGYCTSLGGMTVSISMMVRGFERYGASEPISVLVRSGTLMEEYLRSTGQGFCLQLIDAQDQPQFVKRALRWVREQPRDWPLLLENCGNRQLLPTLAFAAPALRLSGRPVYHIFRDLALSYNLLGNLGRNLAFACLSPRILCNSQFTASHIRFRLGNVQGILYPPVDISQFNERPSQPPRELQSIKNSGAYVMLTPSRISEPSKVNDKNLRTLISVIAQLKASGHHYHGVIIGQDSSPGQTRTRALLDLAKCLGVADRFTILPPTLAIEDYYKYADVVVTLSPREPFGRTVVEAIACGVPVVGSQTGGVGEILAHFAPQWTVDPNNPVAAAEAIVHIAADPDTPNILAQGKRWVEAQCSTVGYARRMIEITGLDAKAPGGTVTELSKREGYSSFHLHKPQ